MHLQTTAKEPSAISGSTCNQTAFAGKPDINLWWLLAGFTLVKWFRGASIKPIMRSVFNCHFTAANCERVQTKEASLGERPAVQNGSRVPLSSILSCWTCHLPSIHIPEWLKKDAVDHLAWSIGCWVQLHAMSFKWIQSYVLASLTPRGWYVCQAEAILANPPQTWSVERHKYLKHILWVWMLGASALSDTVTDPDPEVRQVWIWINIF